MTTFVARLSDLQASPLIDWFIADRITGTTLRIGERAEALRAGRVSELLQGPRDSPDPAGF